MTFLAFLRAHPDEAIQTAAEWLYGTDGGPIDLGEAVGWLDAVGAPSVAFQAVAEGWREFRKAQASGRESGENLK